MAMKEVARLTNVIYWDSDKSSWRKEVKRLEDYKKSWKKATDDIAKADFKSNQAVLRTQRTRAKVEEQIARAQRKQQEAQKKQRAQAVSRLTGGNNAELNSMRKFYQQQAREAARQQKLLDRSVGDVQHRKARVGANSARISSMFDGSLVAQFQSRIQRVNADYAKGAINLQTYNQRMARLRSEMKMATAEAGKFQSRLDKAAVAGSKLHDNLGKLNSTLGKIAIGLTAAGWGVQRAVSSAMSAQSDHNSAYYGLLAQNKDDKAKTDQQMAFIDRISNDYGMDQREAEGGFMRFAAATPNVKEDDKQALFEAMAIKGRSVGATADQQNRAIVALGQIYSKGGRVYAEELKGQLSEALAGSQVDFTQAAIDAGVIKKEEEFNKALEDGKITMDKLLPSLVKIWGAAKETDAFAKSMQQPEVALQRMSNQFFKLKQSFMGVVDPTDNVITLSESLIYIFEDLSSIFSSSGEDAKSLGVMLGEAMHEIYFWVNWAWWWTKKIAKGIGETLGWTAQDAGEKIGQIIAALMGLKVATSIAGMVGGLISMLWKLKAALSALVGVGDISTGGTAGKGRPGKGGLIGKVGRLGRFAGPAAVVATGFDIANGLDAYWQDPKNQRQEGVKHPEWLTSMINGASSFLGLDYRLDAGRYITRPTPTGGMAIQNGGYQPTQISVVPQGEISGKWEITIDEGGIARVIQKEVSDQLDWKATQESNQLF
ncbi:tape measure protein [Escherichia coli]|nr:tape measure protein [Escherichia coli]EEX7757741.1 tape measure protein [Escherichia coli]EEY0216006.1 tape measure protein [Escherichia coli]